MVVLLLLLVAAATATRPFRAVTLEIRRLLRCLSGTAACRFSLTPAPVFALCVAASTLCAPAVLCLRRIVSRAAAALRRLSDAPAVAVALFLAPAPAAIPSSSSVLPETSRTLTSSSHVAVKFLHSYVNVTAAIAAITRASPIVVSIHPACAAVGDAFEPRVPVGTTAAVAGLFAVITVAPIAD